jgi:spermidine dehydrogenase
MHDKRDRELGMDRAITRRDFLNGIALALGASMLPFETLAAFGDGDDYAPEKKPGYYPPGLTGLRGNHPGSFEFAHMMRDGTVSGLLQSARPVGEAYDLIIVGGGISGLAAAHFYRKIAGRQPRILILDNHDDFGGHAKRNEFRSGNRVLLGYGGTQSLEAPGRYSKVAKGVLAELGVDTSKFYKAFDQGFYSSRKLGRGVFFDKETFGSDYLAAGAGERPWAELLAKAPLSDAARRDIARVYEEDHLDHMPGLSSEEKKTKLAKTSYRDFLVSTLGVTTDALPFFQTSTHDLYGVGIDAVPALDLWGLGYPGFKGLNLAPGSWPGISRTAIPHESEEPYIFHFPDGNASIARLLVRTLLPRAVPGHTMEDVVTARVDYARLDEPGSRTRIRLNSTAVRVRHVGDPDSAREVEVTYVRGGKAWTVRAPGVVLACWNGVIPYMCPEIPEAQRAALSYGVKVPLVYTNVALRNWTAFRKLGVSEVAAPGSYHSHASLDFPVSLGTYHFSRSPEEPIVLHMLRTPCHPGLPARQQHRMGRMELLATPYETFERNIRDQLARMLGAGGFDPARDIVGITVNRWSHGYAYEYNSLWDPLWPEREQPCVIGRQPFGRITIANSDAGAYAYTDCAIDQAYRAVAELVARVPAHRPAQYQPA